MLSLSTKPIIWPRLAVVRDYRINSIISKTCKIALAFAMCWQEPMKCAVFAPQRHNWQGVGSIFISLAMMPRKKRTVRNSGALYGPYNDNCQSHENLCLRKNTGKCSMPEVSVASA